MLIFAKFVVLATVLCKMQAFRYIVLCRWGYNPAVSKATRSFETSQAAHPPTERHILKRFKFSCLNFIGLYTGKTSYEFRVSFCSTTRPVGSRYRHRAVTANWGKPITCVTEVHVFRLMPLFRYVLHSVNCR